MSSDEGTSWHSIGGPAEWNDMRFWITSDYIYAADSKNPNKYYPYQSTLWRYRLSNPGLVFSDGSKRLGEKAGSDVMLNYSPTMNAIAGADSLHLVIRYDSLSLVLKALDIGGSWTILDSSSHGNTLDLWLKVDSAKSQNPVLQLTFKTFLASASAKVYLDSAHFYGGCPTCNCPLSVAGPDSVEIDFEGCGDSTLLRYMATGSPFEIESVTPNPARDEVLIRLQAGAARMTDHAGAGLHAGMLVEMYDVLGQRRMRNEELGIRNGVSVDVSSLPSGVYYLRVSSGGFAQSRRVVVQHG
jgi:hypothetical protein